MKNNSFLITIITVIAVGALAFFGGMKYQQSRTSSGEFAGQFQRGQGGQARFGGGRSGGFGGAAVGEVTAVDQNSITLKLMDGSSKIINISSSTTFSKTSTASESDVKVGDRIAAIGTPASDGSVSAQNIQLNPMFRMRTGGQNPQVSPTQ